MAVRNYGLRVLKSEALTAGLRLNLHRNILEQTSIDKS